MKAMRITYKVGRSTRKFHKILFLSDKDEPIDAVRRFSRTENPEGIRIKESVEVPLEDINIKDISRDELEYFLNNFDEIRGQLKNKDVV